MVSFIFHHTFQLQFPRLYSSSQRDKRRRRFISARIFIGICWSIPCSQQKNAEIIEPVPSSFGSSGLTPLRPTHILDKNRNCIYVASSCPINITGLDSKFFFTLRLPPNGSSSILTWNISLHQHGGTQPSQLHQCYSKSHNSLKYHHCFLIA